MTEDDHIAAALAMARNLRASEGYAALSAVERAELDENLSRLEDALGAEPSLEAYAGHAHDPYGQLAVYGGAVGATDATDPALYAEAAATPQDLQRQIAGGGTPQRQQSNTSGPTGRSAPTPAPAQSAEAATQAIGARSADVLEAVDFPGFVAGLVTGTFDAIVDSTKEQVRSYAELVADLTRSLDDFSREKVSDNQVRDYLAEQHGRELQVAFPEAGKPGTPRVLPRASALDSSPAWLGRYELQGESLTEALTEGPLLDAGRRKLGEQRMQTLATMVLMGVNRIVVDEGHIRAKMQFHAAARDVRRAEMNALTAAQQGGVAGRTVASQSATATMVSTIRANAQADASVRADLMGEVHIQFSSETFPLERFADSAAIQLINRQARWQPDKPAAKAGSEDES